MAGFQVLESTLYRSELPMLSITVVFDLDGTVADTAADLIEAANTALAAEGLGPAPAAEVKKGVGYGAKAMLQCAMASLGQKMEAEQLNRLSDRLVEHYEENIAAKTRLFPGFGEAAADLREAGVKLALCTNKRERLTLRLLSKLGIGSLFDAMACGDTYPFHKPDPRHITGAVQLVGGELSAAIMVGDSEVDVAAARGAGIPVIATTFGYAAVPAGELGADAVLEHYAELTALIRELLPGSCHRLTAREF